MKRASVGGGAKRRPKGWTTNRRARQAVLIRGWQPWRRSTGPKTEAGKTRCSMNALKHGFRSCATIQEYRRVRYALRLATRNNEILRLYIRMRDAHSDLKPVYATLLSAATDGLRQFMEAARAAGHAEAQRAKAEKIKKSNDRTNESGNFPTRPVSYERAAERPHGYRRSRATSHGGRQRGSVLRSLNGVGSRGEIARRGGPP